jgi:prepilin-type N-terminal cleavage/methylation domain-containing protein
MMHMLGIRKGFTLTELLIVTVIIAILAAVAVPRFTKSREKTFFAAMKSDLKNLVAAQEIYYAGNSYMYAGAAGSDVPGVTGLQFAASEGVTVTLREVASTGWSADATHQGLRADQMCAITYGNAALLPPSSTPGRVTCTNED